MNRSLIFDLATGAFIGKREDALFLGPAARAKLGHWSSRHSARFRVLYRETMSC